MKRDLPILFIILLTTIHVSAQDVFFQEGTPSTEQKARALVEEYQPELVMTGSQALLFEQKLSEFLLRAEKIRKMNLSTKDRLHMLSQLSEQETQEMVNILTRRQLKRYMKVKPKIQPITGVEGLTENKNRR